MSCKYISELISSPLYRNRHTVTFPLSSFHLTHLTDIQWLKESKCLKLISWPLLGLHPQLVPQQITVNHTPSYSFFFFFHFSFKVCFYFVLGFLGIGWVWFWFFLFFFFFLQHSRNPSQLQNFFRSYWWTLGSQFTAMKQSKDPDTENE